MNYIHRKFWEAIVYNFAKIFDAHIGNHSNANFNKEKYCASAKSLRLYRILRRPLRPLGCILYPLSLISIVIAGRFFFFFCNYSLDAKGKLFNSDFLSFGACQSIASEWYLPFNSGFWTPLSAEEGSPSWPQSKQMSHQLSTPRLAF